MILSTLTLMGGELFTPGALTAAHGGLVSAMATLASAGSGQGHVALFAACAEWLKIWYASSDLHKRLERGTCNRTPPSHCTYHRARAGANCRLKTMYQDERRHLHNASFVRIAESCLES